MIQFMKELYHIRSLTLSKFKTFKTGSSECLMQLLYVMVRVTFFATYLRNHNFGPKQGNHN